MHTRCLRTLLLALLILAVLPPPLRAAERRYALIVGVKSYKKDQFRPLLYSENAANGLAPVFRRAGYKRVVLMTHESTKDEIELLPTVKNIRGAGVAVNLPQAVSYYRQAAAQGHAKAAA